MNCYDLRPFFFHRLDTLLAIALEFSNFLNLSYLSPSQSKLYSLLILISCVLSFVLLKRHIFIVLRIILLYKYNITYFIVYIILYILLQSSCSLHLSTISGTHTVNCTCWFGKVVPTHIYFHREIPSIAGYLRKESRFVNI